MTGNENSFTTRWLAVFFLLVVFALTLNIGGYPLIDPDEGRNAEIAREMAVSGDYVLPHLNGIPYLDKPVLFFAVAAGVMEILGPTELAARLAPFFFALATAVLIGWFSKELYGQEQGWVAAIITVTTPLSIAMSRTVIMDSMLSFFVVAALIFFYRAIEERSQISSELGSHQKWRLWTIAAWIAMALGVLTKGPVALAVPLLVSVPYAFWRRAAVAVWHPIGPAILFLIVTPWVWAVSGDIPDFVHYVFMTETWERLTGDELLRTKPIWYFLPIVLAGFFPWWIPAVLVFRNSRGTVGQGYDPRRVFFWLWLLVPIVFFSLSRSKQAQYILPLVPAVALLVVSRWPVLRRTVRYTAAAWIVFGSLMLTVASTGSFNSSFSSEMAIAAPRTAVILGIAALVAGFAAFRMAPSRRLLAFAFVSLPLAGLPLLASAAIHAMAMQRSVQGLASAIEPYLVDGDVEILGIESYSPGLSFYLRRTVPIASKDGEQLRSNYVIRYFEQWLSADGDLRPLPVSFEGGQEMIFLVNSNDQDRRAKLEYSGYPVLAESRRLVAYGPSPR